MANQILLLSIKPEYAQKIFNGEKKVELRRVRTRLQSGDLVLVYVSSPEQALVGWFEVERVIVVENLPKKLNILWNDVKEAAGIKHQKFRSYYQGASLGVGIFVKKTQRFDRPVELQILRERFANFHPPQSYRYLHRDEINLVESIVEAKIDLLVGK